MISWRDWHETGSFIPGISPHPLRSNAAPVS